jgi:hypothetical protein
VLEANRHGQQLFLVGMFRQKRGPTSSASTADASSRSTASETVSRAYPVSHRQLTLLDPPRDLAVGHEHTFPEPTDTDLADFLHQAAAEHARTHGWSTTRRKSAQHALRLLLGMQETPGAPILASRVLELERIGLAAQGVLDVLDSINMLDDDRVPSILNWYANHVTNLPEPMANEVHTWFEILRTGSSTRPRLHPRSSVTVRLRVRFVLPALRAWTAAGHRSLREITRDEIKAALPPSGSPRALTGQALRSLFKILKARKIIFADPTARIPLGTVERAQPVPLDLTTLRGALGSTDPARAALAALLAFHALRNEQLRALQLTDIRDGRLYLPDHTIPLAAPVRTRLSAWLDYRAHHWPGTMNSHMFLTRYSAVRTTPVSNTWINDTLGMPSDAIRQDRILHEALASGGDVRRLCDMFGLSVHTVQRYTQIVTDPEILESPTPRQGAR